MFWTIIAPELIIIVACTDLIEVQNDYQQMYQSTKDDGVILSSSYIYYANMGGFVIKSTTTRGDMDYDYHDPYHLNAKGIFEL